MMHASRAEARTPPALCVLTPPFLRGRLSCVGIKGDPRWGQDPWQLVPEDHENSVTQLDAIIAQFTHNTATSCDDALTASFLDDRRVIHISGSGKRFARRVAAIVI
jgi:hypothetical protein